MVLKTSKNACYSLFNVKNNLHKWTFKMYINELKLYEKEQEKNEHQEGMGRGRITELQASND